MPEAAQIEKSPVHGTAIAVNERGLLIIGASGSGKSGLGLELICLGAQLVADDQVLLSQSNTGVCMHAPHSITNQIEARFVGIITSPAVRFADLHYVVDLDATCSNRLPERETVVVLGQSVPFLRGGGVPNLAASLFILLRNSWAN